jgi:hypothetical protein
MEESATITQPVILIGVEETELTGFDKVKISIRDRDLIVSEQHFNGKLSVRMINGELEIFVEKEERCSLI